MRGCESVCQCVYERVCDIVCSRVHRRCLHSFKNGKMSC